jgi:hypothetical protein
MLPAVMRTRRVAALATAVAALALVAAAPACARAAAEPVLTVPGVHAPGTPSRYDRTRVRRFGPASARKVLVLVPGTLAGAGDFTLVARELVRRVPGLQVWAQMRREGALQDDTVLRAGLADRATPQQVFDYYLGWLADPQVAPHYQPLAPAQFGFVADWGLGVAMEDLRRVVLRARAGGRRTVILGGHSLGGSEAALYAAWDFAGHAGYKDIAGIVGIDGGPFRRPPETVDAVRAQVAQLATKGPWLDLLGLGLPWTSGAFSETAALFALKQPDAVSPAQSFPLLPAAFRPPVPVTNLAQLGYAFDRSTSPPALALIQVRSGHLATTGSPAGWVDAGPTPVRALAEVFAQEPLGPVDWYYPERLTIDVGAASSMTSTAATRFLGLRLRHVREVDVPYYVIETSLGRSGALATGARRFARVSRIPRLTLVDRSATYSHLDPLLAAPARNDFLKTVVPWLRAIRAR